MPENPLIGKTLIGIQITTDKDMLRFLTTDGHTVAICNAECCSKTWIEHIELPAAGFPCVVTAVEDITMDKEEEWSHNGDVRILFYGCKITTDKGHIIIDYRNESNGYYGGDLSWGNKYYSQSAFDNLAREAEWKPLSEVLTV